MKYTFVFLFCLLAVRIGFALPTLQLDILGGYYDEATKTTVTDGNVFTVRCLLSPNSNESGFLYDDFYLSMATIPKENLNPSGFFTIDGKDIEVTGDMVYGTPPIEEMVPIDDLGPHNIFPTWFCEEMFNFDESLITQPYNTADPFEVINENQITYYRDFQLDLSGLPFGTGIHFDLYNEKLKRGEVEINNFAPFSHDAEGKNVPEPTSLLLLSIGFGLLLIRSVHRVKKVKELSK